MEPHRNGNWNRIGAYDYPNLVSRLSPLLWARKELGNAFDLSFFPVSLLQSVCWTFFSFIQLELVTGYLFVCSVIVIPHIHTMHTHIYRTTPQVSRYQDVGKTGCCNACQTADHHLVTLPQTMVTPWKYAFDVTSNGQCSSSWPCVLGQRLTVTTTIA